MPRPMPGTYWDLGKCVKFACGSNEAMVVRSVAGGLGREKEKANERKAH